VSVLLVACCRLVSHAVLLGRWWQTFLSLLSTRHLQFVDVACGYGFCAAITNKGLLFTWYVIAISTACWSVRACACVRMREKEK
jgi:hypothetical protein